MRTDLLYLQSCT